MNQVRLDDDGKQIKCYRFIQYIDDKIGNYGMREWAYFIEKIEVTNEPYFHVLTPNGTVHWMINDQPFQFRTELHQEL